MSVTYYCSICKINSKEEDVFEDYRQGSIVHTLCGFVLSSQLVTEDAEWRNYDDDLNDKSRVGLASSELFDNILLSTKIGAPKNNKLESDSSQRTSLVQTHTVVTKDTKLDKYVDCYSILEAHANKASLVAAVTLKAKQYLKVFLDNGFRHVDGGIYGASIYLACKQLKCARTMAEVSEFTSIHIRYIAKCIQKYTKLKLPATKATTDTTVENENKENAVSSDIMERACQKLNLPYKIVTATKDLIKEKGSILEGRRPQTISATCLHRVLQTQGKKWSNITQSMIAKAFEVAPTTLKQTCLLL